MKCGYIGIKSQKPCPQKAVWSIWGWHFDWNRRIFSCSKHLGKLLEISEEPEKRRYEVRHFADETI